ncbi:MAG: hypothetical protein WBW33_35405 [Bryobacteraceae bacterium]
MIATHHRSRPDDQVPAWHCRFLTMVPAIRRHAELRFRKLRPDVREELVDEVIANCLVAYARLANRGKENLAFPSALARFAVAQVRQGRQVGSRLNIQDVSSRYAQQQNGIQVERLDQFVSADEVWKEILVEDRRATPADVAASRIDFAAWLAKLPALRRKIAQCLASGESTLDAARRFAVTPGRISQLRREFLDSWLAFQGELPLATAAA